MALIVEDGSIVAGANSYASVAQADAYHADRLNAEWAALATDGKESALIKATDYLEQTYADAWKGYRVDADQPLSWPRYDVIAYTYPFPADSVPLALRNAAIELALKASKGPLLCDEGQRVKRKKVDVLETEYDTYSSPQKRYTAVQRALAPYLTNSVGSGIQVVRLERA